jgi:hypothetical protein
MKKLILCGLALALIFMGFACKKKTGASGRVINFYNKQPLEGVNLVITQFKSTVFNNHQGYVGSGTTNSNGEFAINYTARRNSKYHYDLLVDFNNSEIDTTAEFVRDFSVDYRTQVGFVSSSSLPRDHIKDIELVLAPVSRIKIIFKSKNPGNNDLLEAMTYDSWYTDIVHSFSIPEINAVWMKQPSNGRVLLKWQVNNGDLVYDTIYVKPFEKAVYTLNY